MVPNAMLRRERSRGQTFDTVTGHHTVLGTNGPYSRFLVLPVYNTNVTVLV